MTADPPGLAAALATVQAELPRIVKDKTAQVRSDKGNYSYSYADLAAVTAEVLPLLGRNGLAWIARPTLSEGRLVLAYQLLHTSGESVEGEYPLPNSGTPQAMGSAITYARRYTLCSVTGVAPDTDDDDAAHATEQARPQRTVQRRQREPDPEDDRPRQQVQRQRPQDGPPLPDEMPADDEAPPRGRRGEQGSHPISAAQQRMLHASFNDIGIAEREDRLAYVVGVIGRDVQSSSDLTRAEASKVIDQLVRDGKPAADAEDDGQLPVPGDEP